jgi:hypothetical protein
LYLSENETLTLTGLGVHIYKLCNWAKPITPTVSTLSSTNVETGSKVGEDTRLQPLGEDVGELQRGGDTENPNVTGGYSLADKVQVDLHVLRVLMLHEIGGEVDRVDVVVVDEGGTLEGAVELMEKLAQLGGLCHAVGHSAVTGLHAEREMTGCRLAAQETRLAPKNTA